MNRIERAHKQAEWCVLVIGSIAITLLLCGVL